MTLDRRSFLGTSAATGAAVALSGVAGAATPAAAATRTPVRRLERRAVIIGSGFGGGVVALRLAQAGVDNLVLERGRWWRPAPNSDTFPTIKTLDERALWRGSDLTQPFPTALFGDFSAASLNPYVGLIDAHVGTGMTALCAAGVGGGSLIYQGMSLQPNREVFESIFPAGVDYTEMNRRHYRRAGRVLHIQTAPDELIASENYKAPRAFRRRAREAGYRVEKTPMPIDWDFSLAELRGEMKPAYTTGDTGLGVNNGGKFSVDKTYIAKAMRTGRTTVWAQHEVVDIEQDRRGRYLVHVHKTDRRGRVLARKVIRTPTLVMGAGSMGTTKMLTRAKALGAIRGLPDEIGEGWGSNGDRIYVWESLTEDFGRFQGGPVIYDSKDWKDARTANTVIQASLPPLPLELQRLNATILVGFGVSPDRGRWVYDPLGDEARLLWNPLNDLRSFGAIHERVLRISGGTVLDTNAAVNTTWHGLGGAVMGEACDLDGRVNGMRGLYVLDGALIPGSTGACNPSLTIAAVAERAMDRIVKRDVGRVI
ncbi:hypothetical protein KLP28_12460 [Nocardioidaceae bacterium]|nr:hypothetical protein KLP28_12460 [Nocardioidaceae bacterium]